MSDQHVGSESVRIRCFAQACRESWIGSRGVVVGYLRPVEPMLRVRVEQRPAKSEEHLPNLLATAAQACDAGSIEEAQVAADRQMMFDLARRADRHPDESRKVGARFASRAL